MKRQLDELKVGLFESQSGTSQALHAQKDSQASANLATSSEKWIIDTDVIDHYSSMRHLFSNFQPHNQPDSMTIADGSIIPILGRGSISTSFATHYLVSFVPNISINLLFISALTKSLPCSATFLSNRCTF